jgi:hypothetical protein
LTKDGRRKDEVLRVDMMVEVEDLVHRVAFSSALYVNL